MYSIFLLFQTTALYFVLLLNPQTLLLDEFTHRQKWQSVCSLTYYHRVCPRFCWTLCWKGRVSGLFYCLPWLSEHLSFKGTQGRKKPHQILTRNGGVWEKGQDYFIIHSPLDMPRAGENQTNPVKGSQEAAANPRTCLLQMVEAAMQLPLPCRRAQGWQLPQGLTQGMAFRHQEKKPLGWNSR